MHMRCKCHWVAADDSLLEQDKVGDEIFPTAFEMIMLQGEIQIKVGAAGCTCRCIESELTAIRKFHFYKIPSDICRIPFRQDRLNSKTATQLIKDVYQFIVQDQRIILYQMATSKL